jgi:hypothetical protein
MARLARVVTTDTLYHITQRANARRLVFETNTTASSTSGSCSAIATAASYPWWHMPDLQLRRPDSMAVVLRHIHGRYAAYIVHREQEAPYFETMLVIGEK